MVHRGLPFGIMWLVAEHFSGNKLVTECYSKRERGCHPLTKLQKGSLIVCALQLYCFAG